MEKDRTLEVVAVGTLAKGMFVAELDRPWLQTTFPMQGFLIDDEDQLAQLHRQCRFVYVDRRLSTGEHFRAASNDEDGAQIPRLREASDTPLISSGEQGTERGFFDVLKTLQNEKAQPGRAILGGGRESARKSAEVLGDWKHWFGDRFRRRSPQQEAQSGPVEEAKAAEWGNPVVKLRPVALPVEKEMPVCAIALDSAQTIVVDVVEDIRRNRIPGADRVVDVVEAMADSVLRNPDALVWLSRLKRLDDYTYDHAIDVSTHMMVFGRYLGFDRERITLLGTVGLLQDLGKLQCPPDLLNKQEKLTRPEVTVLRRHVDQTLKMLSNWKNIDPRVVDIASKHHERIDGSGYPNALAGEAIGLDAEIAGLIDSYCAMLVEKPYRPAMDSQRAVERLIRRRGEKFSESVVDQFIQCVGLYPVGTLVELNSGEVAVVIEQNWVRRMKPRVMILLAPDHTPNRYPITLDLILEPLFDGEKPYQITKSLHVGAYGLDPREFYL